MLEGKVAETGDVRAAGNPKTETDVILENEIRQLERSINTLICRPKLIRREYWASQTERLLLVPGLSERDRRRLSALLVLLGVAPREQAPQPGSPAAIVGISESLTMT